MYDTPPDNEVEDASEVEAVQVIGSSQKIDRYRSEIGQSPEEAED